MIPTASLSPLFSTGPGQIGHASLPPDLKSRFLDGILANSSEAVAVIDPQGVYVLQNEAHRRLVGFSDRELEGRTPAIHLGDDTFGRVAQALATHDYFRGEVTSHTRDGDLDLEVTAFTVRGPRREVLGHVGIHRDLTRRKSAEQQLERRVEQLEALHALSDDMAQATEPQEIYDAAIACLRRALGVERSSIVLVDAHGARRFAAWKGVSDAGRDAVDGPSPRSAGQRDAQPVLVPDALTEPGWAAQAAAFRAEGIGALAFLPLVQAGEPLGRLALYFDGPHTFMPDEVHLAQTIAGAVAFALQRNRVQNAEVDARRRTAQALSELVTTQQGLEAILENTSAMVFVKDLAGRFTITNRSFDRFMGIEVGSALGRHTREVLPAEAAERNLADDRNVLEAGHAMEFEETMPSPGGPRTFLVIKFPVHRAGGEIFGLCGICTDITDRKKAEENLRQLNAELEERVNRRTAQLENAVRELESFNYSVSHDLRTPLRTIRGFTHLLLRDEGLKLDPEARSHLDYVYAATERMSEIIEDLLKLSRVNRGELRRVPVDLSEMAREIAGDLAAREPDRKVEMVVEPGLTTSADPQLVRVVLENLIQNAWKFTGRHPTARIEFGMTERDAQRTFFVRDDGAGFDPAQARNLFQPFTRLHHSSVFPGTGIGLATVQRIIRRHGGAIQAEARPEQGATFWFTL